MRKKYFALIMAGVLSSLVFMSGCGGSNVPGTEVEEDEDEDDEDEDEEDENEGEGEDDVEPEKPVMVQEIDEETLTSQINFFVDNRDEFFFPDTEDYFHSTCMVTDLDFNGRCELVLSGARWYGVEHEYRIYEINEAGDGVTEIKYGFTGIDSDESVIPQFGCYNVLRGYYDKETGTFHYLMRSSYSDDPNQTYGTWNCDFSLINGTIENNIYAKYQYKYLNPDYEYTYWDADGEIDEDEYDELNENYPDDHVVKEFSLGLYEGDYYYPLSDGDIEKMEPEKLTSVLLDSYKVFSGELDYEEFFRIHTSHRNGYDDKEELLKDCVGTWGLYLTDTEGSITYYDSDDEFYSILTVYEDGTMYLREDINSDYAKEITIELGDYEYASGMLFGEYYPNAKEDVYYDRMEYLITDVNMDGMLVLSHDAWYGSEYVGGSYWYFVRLD